MSTQLDHDLPEQDARVAEDWDPASIEKELDLRRYERPIPVVIASRFLRELAPGKLLKAITRDSRHGMDFRALVQRQHAFRLVAQESTERGHIVILARREE